MKRMFWMKRFIVLVGDMVMLGAGFYLALALRRLSWPSTQLLVAHIPLFSATILIWVVINYINGLYDLTQLRSKRAFYKQLTETAVVSLLIGTLFFYLVPQKEITPKTILLLSMLLGYSLIALWRIGAHRLIGVKKLETNIIFVGCTQEVLELIHILQTHPHTGYKVRAIIDPDAHEQTKQLSKEISVYGSLRAIRPAITTHGATLAVIAPHIHNDEAAMRELYELLFWPVQILDVTAFYELMTGRIPPFTFSEGWFLENLRHKKRPIYDKSRALIDLLAAAIIGTIFLFFLPFVALGIKLTSKGPVFFTQKRVGQFGETFTLYKFRSMYALASDGSAETDGAQFAKKGDSRITAFGKFMRKTRIDELPQVINLLRRDMTLIGPRPERPEIVEQLVEEMPYYPLRHVVRPGIMGWSVLHLDYTDTMAKTLEKLQYDLYYIKNRSLLLDLSILLRTVKIVLRGSGQ